MVGEERPVGEGMPVGELSVECIDVVPERYGAGPTLMFRLRVSERTGVHVHAIALRCQMRIEPLRRTYTDAEAELLMDVFGERSRWSNTQRPIQFAYATVMVPSFAGAIDVDVPVPVSYDLEVATGKYLHALTDEPVPLVLMFSGTVFGRSDRGFWVEPVPWHTEARFGLPVAVWRELMDTYFPHGGWLRLRRETLDTLIRYKARRGVATWDDVMMELVEAGSVETGSVEAGSVESVAPVDDESNAAVEVIA